jgi:hypothetical protein
MSGPLKTAFTNSRRPQIALCPETRELEEKWGKYCFVPFDIPKIGDDPKLVEWLKENSKPTIKIREDIAGGIGNRFPVFNSVDIKLYGEKHNVFDIWKRNYDHNFLDEFPYFHEQMMDLLPFHTITDWHFWQSNIQIIPHRDQQDFRDFPNSFRSMIYDENPCPTLYVKEDVPDSSVTFPEKFIRKLPNTNTFAWNNLRVMHGSFYLKNYSKMLLIINNRNLDVVKYNKLMERSIEKYADHLLVSNNSIDSYIDI